MIYTWAYVCSDCHRHFWSPGYHWCYGEKRYVGPVQRTGDDAHHTKVVQGEFRPVGPQFKYFYEDETPTFEPTEDDPTFV